MTHSFRTVSRLLACSALVVLTACGGSDDGAPDPVDPPDPLAPYKAQVLAWSECDPDTVREEADAIAQLGDRVTCATLRAPMDYAAPDKGDLHIALLRIAAEGPDVRKGAIFFNPGGPGADGLTTPAVSAALFTLGDPASPLGRNLKQISRTYDLIGFSPRGTGASTTFTCESDDAKRPVSGNREDRTPQNIDNMLYNARITASACQANPLHPYISTEHVVQDVDLARAVLGDDKLSFLGTSYGTWLGAWYASRFPQRIDRLVLDSSMNVTSDFQHNALDQNRSNQRVLDQVLAPYAERHHDVFQLGTADQVRALMHTTLRPEIREAVRDRLHVVHPFQAENTLSALAGASGLEQIMRQAEPDLSEPRLLQGIANHHFSADPSFHQAAQGQAYLLIHNMRHPEAPEPVHMTDDDAVNLAVICNDTPSNRDPAFWIEQGDIASRDYPINGGASVTEQPCIDWMQPPVSRPSLGAMQNLDVLMLQSEFDGLTSLEGARAAFAQLPRASMVLLPGGYQHGLFPYGDDCVDWQVSRYLTGEPLVQRDIVCQALPLSRDEIEDDSAMTRTARSTAQQTQPTYTDPARAAALIQRIHTRRLNGTTSPAVR